MNSMLLDEPIDLAETSVHGENLIAAFMRYADKIQVLSLDCFDTLFWRTHATPMDVFYELQYTNAFQSAGISATQRTDAEIHARLMKFIKHGSYEAKLSDIYHFNFRQLNDAQIAALMETEIDLESKFGFVFPPVLELIKLAHQHGIKIVICSNTYFNESQLRRLLSAFIPDPVMRTIEKIYCSSEVGVAKTEGLFKHILHDLNIMPDKILHIGDHPAVDYDYPAKLGLHALHFAQFDHYLLEMFRLQTIAASIANPLVRNKIGLFSPFKGMFACRQLQAEQPHHQIGYLTLGPLMYAFAVFLDEDLRKLRQTEKQLKIVYLMRDGYLLARAYEAYSGIEQAHQISISRFNAIAASFRSKDDIDNYLSKTIHTQQMVDICRQLLLTDEMSTQIIQHAQTTNHPQLEFIRSIQREYFTQYILTQSGLYRERLCKYLRKSANINEGDTVVLVDIGYLGTVQQLITPLLCEEIGVKQVLGRYLMMLITPEWQIAKRGLIDPSWCDDRLMLMLGDHFALIEELCSNGENNTVNYDEAGNPILDSYTINAEQRKKVKLIQDESIRFINDANAFMHNAKLTISLEVLRQYTLIELVRFINLPMAGTVQYLQQFQHERNSASHGIINVFTDPNLEIANLRHYGLLFKHQHPFGLRSAGLELLLTSLLQRRHGFEVNSDDLSFRREYVTVVNLRNNHIQQHTMAAKPTYDGYFSLLVPISQRDEQIGVLLGLKYRLLKIEKAELIRATLFLSGHIDQPGEDVTDKLVLHHVRRMDANHLECLSSASAIMFKPHSRLNENFIFRLIYRPCINAATQPI